MDEDTSDLTGSEIGSSCTGYTVSVWRGNESEPEGWFFDKMCRSIGWGAITH